MVGNGRQVGMILRAACAVLLCVGCARAVFLGWEWFGGGTETVVLAEAAVAGDTEPPAPDIEQRVAAFCGDCHAVPKPDGFPRRAWPQGILRAYTFYAKSGRQDLVPPAMQETLAYYLQRAPEALTFPELKVADHQLAVTFEIEQLSIEETGGVKSAVSHLKWMRLHPDAEPVLVVSDMRRGSVKALSLRDQPRQPRLLARLNNPCHVEPCDLDGDGAIDLVVADLGTFIAQDHDRGRVVWLRRHEEADRYEPIVVAAGLGRVADVRPGDFDGDGDIDLLVAIFGMNKTGDIRMLWNVAPRGESPRFEMEVLDPRPGAVHVPVQDLNGDGHLDFAALISQEYEQIAVFLNQQGSNQRLAPFHVRVLWEGPDLTFGLSGMQLVDLDRDGDTDILFTNGDAFDNNFVNPSHGVQWLEYRGDLTFEYHHLTHLAGAYVALPGDIDLDGDLDIVVSAWAPKHAEPREYFEQPRPSLLCLEQTAPGVFATHVLEMAVPYHAAMELADFDGDGDLDIAVGYDSQHAGWVDIWWNRGKRTADRRD